MEQTVYRIKPVFYGNKKGAQAPGFSLGLFFTILIFFSIGAPDPRDLDRIKPAFIEEVAQEINLQSMADKSFRIREDVLYKLRFNGIEEKKFTTAEGLDLSEASLAHELFRNLDLQFVDSKLDKDRNKVSRFISGIDAAEYSYQERGKENVFLKISNEDKVVINSFGDNVISYLKGEQSLPYRFAEDQEGLTVVLNTGLDSSKSNEFPINLQIAGRVEELRFYR